MRSFEAGPNGPLVPELKESFADAPYIARPGQINAWDNEDFVKAVKASTRRLESLSPHILTGQLQKLARLLHSQLKVF